MSDLPLPDPTETHALDIQHDTDPEHDHGIAHRIPHLGHALLFFAITAFALLFAAVFIYAFAHVHTQAAVLAHPGFALMAQGAGYAAAFAISFWVFPLIWHRGFFAGVHWNASVAKRHWLKIVVTGILVSIAAQLAINFVSSPEKAPIDQIMGNAHIIWYMALFAVLIGPFMEELAFRGFLLPALATAYDWLALERTPAGLDRWQRSTAHSTPALIFSAIISSVPFALLHAAQIGYAWGVVCILYGVSLALSLVRIRTQSLACSTLMHATYNGFIFVLLFISSSGFRHLDKIGR
ncbi:CPBP family intramembrane metalloprotease [Granulicella sp. 5B5]|uniref:CPBP family intramembrane glutamic endopeptidase n=1 Tax=Granulicella sp. 5B5 TaxID=1617967 RepID=UPI0015F46F62|nr:type II CAAX endopeptidase family protein [Granulicella sp. 5B5]QMV17786.1 CPBP family intramembrane metalloprotease [Granulicella sp. 5B5]